MGSHAAVSKVPAVRDVALVALRMYQCTAHRSLYGEARRADAENFYDTSVEQYAKQPIKRITLGQMLRFGQDVLKRPELLAKSAGIVQEELPKRLARRLLDLQFLPHLMVINPHIRQVYDGYLVAFHALKDMPRVSTLEENAAFTTMLMRLIEEHGPMLDSLALGLRECQQKRDMRPHVQLDGFLDAMLRSRISRRIIAEQHVALQRPRPAHVGVINTQLSVRPEVVIEGDTTLPQIAAHLDYMLYELLKNAMRATMERERAVRGNSSAAQAAPPIVVSICDGADMVTIRVADRGGGLPAGVAVRDVWRYGFTTIGNGSPGDHDVSAPHQDSAGLSGLQPQYAGAGGRYRMAGLGFGLPMTRLHATYFGGDCMLVDLPGYGVDVYLTLRHLYEWEWSEEAEDSSGIALPA